MAIKNRKKRITARISALLLSAAMLCSLSACSDPVAVTKIKGTPTEAGAAESTLLHSVGDKANLQQVGKSGLIELLFDESTYSVCVADLSHDDSEKLWSALPTQENSGAATATLEIVSGDTLYKLNTQDNSVSFQNAQCSFADDALSVTYILTPDTATAHKEKYEKGDIAFKLVVNYQIKTAASMSARNMKISLRIPTQSSRNSAFSTSSALIPSPSRAIISLSPTAAARLSASTTAAFPSAPTTPTSTAGTGRPSARR